MWKVTACAEHSRVLCKEERGEEEDAVIQPSIIQS